MLREYFIIGIFITLQENISLFFFLNSFLILRIFLFKKKEKESEKCFKIFIFFVRFLHLGEIFLCFFRRQVYATNI